MNCPLQARRCGGCTRLSVPYEKQLRVKQDKVNRFFPGARPILYMKNPTHYRNKVIAAFAHDKSGLISGMYAFGTHYVLPVDQCLLENARADEIVCTLRRILEKNGVRAYDEDKKTGLIRFVQARFAEKTRQALVTIVTAAPEFKEGVKVAQELKKACPDVRSVVQNINQRPGSAVLGALERMLLGDGVIEDTLCGKRLLLSSRSFYQVNSAQAARLYEAALNMTHITKNDTVLDAYCGVGVIGLIAADKADAVVGIEINADAVRMARENAKMNHVENIRFVQGDAGKMMQDIGFKPTVALLDPPRAGCDEAFLSALCALGPKKICYISCDIETQARDAGFLRKNGYRLLAAQPVDMFPHTDHIENIGLFER